MLRARLVRLVLGLVLVTLGHPPEARAATLTDSTVTERWTLPNGLRVVTRQIPRARDVAITVGYRIGMDDDPAEHPGLAELAGDLGFNAATADEPARTPADLDKDLPQGWSDPVLRHLTLFTEAVPRDRAAAILARVATRMRGVRLDVASVDAAAKRVKRELAQQVFGPPGLALAFEVREVASGASDAQMVKRASGAGIDGLTVAELKAVIENDYVPANAVLSITGDLHGLDVHAEVTRLFGSIPGGRARPENAERKFAPAERVLRRRGDPSAIIGVIAPPLADSLHATFYMGVLLFGGLADQTWYPPDATNNKPSAHAPVIDYSLFDEPELVRIFPPVKPTETDYQGVTQRMAMVDELMRGEAEIPSDSYDEMRASVTWLIGGPMSAPQGAAVRGNRLAMMSLSRAQACCELRRGPGFWSGYLHRMMAVRPGQPELWGKWISDPAHQVRVMALPNPK